jgi:hypothetical protein
MKPFEKSALALALTSALGCGGDSSSGHVDTGLAEATALRDVTSSESVTACENVRSAIQTEFDTDQTVRRVCELFGAALTETTAECQSQADTCVTDSENGTNSFVRRDELDFSAGLECDGDVSDFEGCAVTVGEYESCMDARLDQVDQLFSQFSCGQAASIEMDDAQGFVRQLTQPDTPAACERLQTECPEASPFAGDEN